MKLLFLIIACLMSSCMSNLIDLDSLYETNDLYDPLYNLTMEWGTLKPNLFFGIKNRNANPINVGLVWVVPENGRFTVRHTYKYESGDGVTAYYELHDGWGTSKQIIEDPKGNVRFEVEFVKQIITEGAEYSS